MALPSSGQLSLNDIRIELGLSQSNISLGSMSDTAGFIAPDAISDFYGYSATTLFYTDALGSSLPTQACNATPVNAQKWHNGSSALPTLNDTVYADSNGTTVFNGGNKWYRMGTNPFIIGTTVVRINSSGVVFGESTC